MMYTPKLYELTDRSGVVSHCVAVTPTEAIARWVKGWTPNRSIIAECYNSYSPEMSLVSVKEIGFAPMVAGE